MVYILSYKIFLQSVQQKKASLKPMPQAVQTNEKVIGFFWFCVEILYADKTISRTLQISKEGNAL